MVLSRCITTYWPSGWVVYRRSFFVGLQRAFCSFRTEIVVENREINKHGCSHESTSVSVRVRDYLSGNKVKQRKTHLVNWVCQNAKMKQRQTQADQRRFYVRPVAVRIAIKFWILMQRRRKEVNISQTDAMKKEVEYHASRWTRSEPNLSIG